MVLSNTKRLLLALRYILVLAKVVELYPTMNALAQNNKINALAHLAFPTVPVWHFVTDASSSTLHGVNKIL